MSGLSIEHLNKSFDGNVILHDISLEVSENDLLVVLGPSGCGKSTLLRLIAGLETPDSGTIVLDDRDITRLEPQKRKTAMVFQNYALYPHMTVYDNLAFPLKVARTDKTDMDRLVKETAALLEIDALLDRHPAQLSGGQRQRVALGRGLVRQPSIFLLDEPLSNLDAALRLKMRQEIVSLQKRLGITMIYVTHDQVEALTMADSLVVLKDGRIRQQGTPSELYTHPADSFVASFIGTPPINLYADQIADKKGHAIPLQFDDTLADGEYTVGIRPEHIHIAPDGAISGEVTAVEYIGAVSYVRVQVGEIDLTVTVPGETESYTAGQTVKLAIDQSQVHLFPVG
jgi:ABC-type sugar transport system ATPase subunit